MVEVSESQGRYYILESGPVASPGHCAVCGYSGSERRYIDPRLDFEWYGSAIFCEECVASMARLFNYIEPAQALALEARVEEAERELIRLRAVALQIESLRELLGSSSIVSDGIHNSSTSDLALFDAGSTPTDFSESDRGSAADDSETERPTTESRSNDLRSTVTGDNFSLDFI